MRRFWIDKTKLQETQALIDGELFHHIIDVCRMDETNRFELLYGEGVALLVQLSKIEKRKAWANILGKRQIQSLAQPYITLAISLPKIAVFESVLEKCVELGVKRVIPFVSDYSFVKTLQAPVLSKQERWKKIILSATQQSGRGDVMELNPALSRTQVLDKFNQDHNARGLFAYEGEAELDLRSALTQMKTSSPQNIWAFIGSEGGFSVQEVELFKSLGHSPVTMGNQVLRVETACLSLLSVIKYEFDLMK